MINVSRFNQDFGAANSGRYWNMASNFSRTASASDHQSQDDSRNLIGLWLSYILKSIYATNNCQDHNYSRRNIPQKQGFKAFNHTLIWMYSSHVHDGANMEIVTSIHPSIHPSTLVIKSSGYIIYRSNFISLRTHRLYRKISNLSATDKVYISFYSINHTCCIHTNHHAITNLFQFRLCIYIN